MDESYAILGLIFRQQLKPEFVIRWNWTSESYASSHPAAVRQFCGPSSPGRPR